MNALLADLKSAMKQLRARPGLWATIIITLALGLGANAAVFSVFQRLLLEPLPFQDGDQLLMVYNSYPKNDLEFAGTSVPDYLDRREQVDAFADIGMFTYETMNVLSSGEADRWQAMKATPSLFSTLGVKPVIGRAFMDQEADTKNRVVVLGDGAWLKLFERAPSAIGQQIKMNGESWQVIGVMPPQFQVPGYRGFDADMYIPFGFTPEQRSDNERGHEYSLSIARLKPGATLEQAEQAMSAIVARNGARAPAEYKAFWDQAGFTGKARNLREFAVGDTATTIRLLQWSTLLVLLIACANVANLMMAASTARVREYAVRSALGAGLWRLARQTLVEAIVAAALAALLGLAIGHLMLLAFVEMGAGSLPFGFQASVLSAENLLALGGGTLIVAMLIACLPIFAVMRRSRELGLKDAGRGSVGNRATTRLRSGLVIAQLALSVALLISAGLLMRSYARVLAESPGFDGDGVWSATIALPSERYADDNARRAFFTRLNAELKQMPGLTEFGMIEGLPFSRGGGMASYSIEGRKTSVDQPMPHGNIRIADEGFFQTMRIPLLRGRYFEASDTELSEPVAIVDQVLVDKYFADVDPIGQRITNDDTDGEDVTWYRIVGVVGTVKTASLDQNVMKETYYMPMRQVPANMSSIVVRSNLPSEALAQGLRERLRRIDPEQPIYDISTLDARILSALGSRRAPMALIGVFAGSALVLSVIGLYGLLNFLVGQRHGEFGVRLAMGAQASDLFRAVLSQGGRLIALGLVLGVLLAAYVGQWLRAQLFGVGAFDLLTFVTVLSTLGITGLLACVLPARLAARVDPMRVLRAE